MSDTFVPQLSETIARQPAGPRIAVVIPCYRVARQLPGVLARIGPAVSSIYCIDDGCPEGSGAVATEAAVADRRVRVVTHAQNMGVGAAVVTGYQRALADGAEIVVKLDGDGQMDPRQLPLLVAPILRGEADYVKGNRFFSLEGLRPMPWARLVGNAGLSFLSKLSTGYWDLFDPTNGYTAIHAAVARVLPLAKLSRGYFVETDILFRLSTLRAAVTEIPMPACYGDEHSSLHLFRALIAFPFCHARCFVKRVFYNYFLRGFSIASVNLVLGLLCLGFGVSFGTYEWIKAVRALVFASAGTVMVAALPVVLGSQLLLSFFTLDMANTPREPIFRKVQEWPAVSPVAADRRDGRGV
jgi:dolichol-phosphate mannosyltransferase